jgi:hypothetical protein
MVFAKGKGKGHHTLLKRGSPSQNNSKKKRREVRLKRLRPRTMLLSEVSSETHLTDLITFAQSQEKLSHFENLKVTVRTKDQRNLLTTCLFVPDTTKILERKYEDGIIRLLDVVQDNKLWHLRIYIDHSWQYVPPTLQVHIIRLLQDDNLNKRVQLVFVLHPATPGSLAMTAVRFLPFGELGRGHHIVSTVDIDQTPTKEYLQMV